jgi:hypothetical protein
MSLWVLRQFDKFIQTNLQVGKRKMGARHRAILSNAKALGFTFGVGLGKFFVNFWSSSGDC